ncbi:MAG: hypothetical protein LC792_02985 [Actinobacteria bacterium]|nr:hypothetical protein [Actinomycetota bacterium]
MTKTVEAPSVPSGDTRARLGSPASGRSWTVVKSGPKNRARYGAPKGSSSWSARQRPWPAAMERRRQE